MKSKDTALWKIWNMRIFRNKNITCCMFLQYTRELVRTKSANQIIYHLIIACSSKYCLSEHGKNRPPQPASKKVLKKKAIVKLHTVSLKLKVHKVQIMKTSRCKNLRSEWLQTWLYQESKTWNKNRGVNLMRPQNLG